MQHIFPFIKALGPYVPMDRSRIVFKRIEIETYQHIVEKYKKEELIRSHFGGKLNYT